MAKKPKVPEGWTYEPMEASAPGAPQLPPGWAFERMEGAPKEKAQPQTSTLEAMAAGAAQVPLGLGEELGAALQGMAMGPPLPPSEARKHPELFPNGTADDVYRQARSENREVDAAAKEQHGRAYYSPLIAGTLATAPLLPGGAATQGAKLLSRVKAAAKAGAGLGAIGGLGAGEADLTQGDVGGAALETGVGALGGSVIGGGIPIAGAALRPLTRGLVKPTEAARLLQRKGVELSVGQMAPQSVLAGFEDAGQSSGLFGKALERVRQRGRETWQRAVINQARAPGTQRLSGIGEPADQLAQVYQGYGPAYDAVRDVPVNVRGIGDSLSAAIDDPRIYATPADLAAAQRFVGQQAGLIDRVQPAAQAFRATGTGGGTVNIRRPPADAGALLEARSNIRAEIAARMRAGDNTGAKLLQNAENVLSSTLEEALPEEAAQALRATDAQYGRYKVVEDAVRRSGDQPGGFSPAQLSAAVRSATQKGSYARGGGGTLRDLASAGREVLDSSPQTGARLPASKGAAFAWLANQAPVKRALLGETSAQKLAVTVDDWLRQQGIIDALRRVSSEKAGETLGGAY